MTDISGKRLLDTMRDISQIGRVDDVGVERLALSGEDSQARKLLTQWFSELYLEQSVDSMGNMRGRLPGRNPSLSPVVIGSHLDTVPNGGRYDGVLGVLSALEVIRTLRDRHICPLRSIDIINFTNEEGARFQPAMLASGVMAGVFSEDFAYSRQDKQGISFEDALCNIGYKGTLPCKSCPIHSYLELHIEQGPCLERAGVPIGIVEGILGIRWYKIRWSGVANHAGPTPMSERRDALVAAAKLVTKVYEMGVDASNKIRTTVGRIEVMPNIVNAIPGTVECFVDIRSESLELLQAAEQKLRHEVQVISEAMNVRADLSVEWSIEPAIFASEICAIIERLCQRNGMASMRLMSGAGHDAQYMSKIAPTAMIFVPSINGRSHCSDELTKDEDVVRGCQLLLDATLELAEQI